MNAIKSGIELHETLEAVFNSPSAVMTKALDEKGPEVFNEPAVRLALENYKTAVADLDRVLNEVPPKLKTVFEETLRSDGVYEYTSTGTCDGSQSYAFRRKPAIAANPSSWESIEEIPEGAKYNND